MIGKEKLKSLLASRSDGLFLTAFLSTSRLDDWRQTSPTFLNSEFNRITNERGLDKKQERALRDDLDRILEVVQYEVTHQTQGLAVFADGDSGVFEVVELPFRLANRLVADTFPYVRPLVHALSLLEPFLLVRVSRDDSSIYVVDEWRLAREEDYAGPYLKSTDRETGDVPVKEYYAAARQESLIEHHFKEVAGALDKALDEGDARRVAICGQHDIVSNFRKALSTRAAARVAAEIPWDANASVNQMLVSARAALDEARHGEMTQLAERIQEGLGAQGHGEAGFDATLAALRRGQVRTLLVDRGYRPGGWRCTACDNVVLAPAAACPVCAGGLVPVSDAVGEAVRTAVLQNTFVEVAEGIPALDALGGIGGVLRFV